MKLYDLVRYGVMSSIMDPMEVSHVAMLHDLFVENSYPELAKWFVAAPLKFNSASVPGYQVRRPGWLESVHGKDYGHRSGGREAGFIEVVMSPYLEISLRRVGQWLTKIEWDAVDREIANYNYAKEA